MGRAVRSGGWQRSLEALIPNPSAKPGRREPHAGDAVVVVAGVGRRVAGDGYARPVAEGVEGIARRARASLGHAGQPMEVVIRVSVGVWRLSDPARPRRNLAIMIMVPRPKVFRFVLRSE